ncbi:MAG: hypothetical protein QNJ68_16500 [Microcoleaceae cyanobacterium MO_207.B10]|nr:hypothetical protein [Microcoleaceae cyanobacterium MO_207.B10]
MNHDSHKVKVNWKELDILRSLAALLMIVNHVGVQTLDPSFRQGLPGFLLFVGSFAPVLYFFITGVGYGIQSTAKKKNTNWSNVANKILILFLADILMKWSGGTILGLDFLGFIGLSSLILELIRKTKYPLAYCCTGFILVFLLRYIIGSMIRDTGYDWGIVTWIVGTSKISGISYPLSPWLAYPLFGYIIGWMAMNYREFINIRRLKVISGLFVAAAFPTLAGIIMLQAGLSFHRWGTVALAFYIVSFAIILIGLAVSLVIGRETTPKICQDILSLRGISALAVVPVHYFIIYLVVISGATELNFVSYCLVTLVILIASFYLARSVEQLSQKLRKIERRKLIWFTLSGIFLLAASLTLFWGINNPVLAMLPRTVGQIVLCQLLVVRWH